MAALAGLPHREARGFGLIGVQCGSVVIGGWCFQVLCRFCWRYVVWLGGVASDLWGAGLVDGQLENYTEH